MIDYQLHYKNLLKHHAEIGYLRDPNIQRVLESIPLEYILEENQLMRFVLKDSPALFYYKDQNNVRTISAPHMISIMMSMLELHKLDKVLILGSKGGLLEAAIAKIVESVVIVEENEEVATITEEAFIKIGMKNIWVHRNNPYRGFPEDGKYNKIIITGAIPFIPNAILNQLEENGILVFPMILSQLDFQVIFQVIKMKTELRFINFGSVIFSHLYTTKFPPIDREKDYTLTKLITYAKKHPKEYIFKRKPFFEEYRHLPNIEIYQIVFQNTQQIYFSKNLDDKIPPNKKVQDSILLQLENPGNNCFIDIIIIGFKNDFILKKKKISIIPGSKNIIPVRVDLPINESDIIYDITILSQEGYRLTNIKLKIYLLINNRSLNYSLELQ